MSAYLTFGYVEKYLDSHKLLNIIYYFCLILGLVNIKTL
jgi:hypothetical protein